MYSHILPQELQPNWKVYSTLCRIRGAYPLEFFGGDAELPFVFLNLVSTDKKDSREVKGGRENRFTTHTIPATEKKARYIDVYADLHVRVNSEEGMRRFLKALFEK